MEAVVDNMKLKQTEAQLLTACRQYLRYKRFYTMRINSGKYAIGEGRNKRFVLGQEAGTPDLIAFKKPLLKFTKTQGSVEGNVVLYFFELKVGKNKPTVLQEAKMNELREYGANVYVIHNLEELEKVCR